MKRWWILACMFLVLCAPWTTVTPIDSITTADAVAIHEVVQTQLDALSRDDAGSAFALASEEKRYLIGSADKFLRMMKEQYSPIYRHRSAILSTPELVGGGAVQLVRVADSDGKVWIALFWMLQEKNGSWKIDGCHLLGTDTIST